MPGRQALFGPWPVRPYLRRLLTGTTWIKNATDAAGIGPHSFHKNVINPNARPRQTLFFVLSLKTWQLPNPKLGQLPGVLLRPNKAGTGPQPMEMKTETINGDVTKIILTGRLDILGAQQIDLHFAAITGSQRKVIVDLEGVLFLASMGIRTLIMGAKSVKSKGGHIVLLKPTADVEKVLTGSGTDTVVPIMHDLESAIAAVLG
jgi:anti-sigma B factor antagonist